MKGEEKQAAKAMDQLGSKLKDANSEDLEKVLKKATEGAVTPKDLLKLDDAKIESIYAQSYRFYNTGKFKEASDLFRYLMLLNPTEAKYALGLAACFHMLKNYKAAAQVYLLCSTLDENSPIPGFHASDCYLQMNDRESALVALKIAIKKAGNKPEYKILKDRAELTVKNLQKELNLKEDEE